MAVVTNVNADFAHAGFEDRITEVAGAEVEFFPESGIAVRDVHFSEFAEVGAVGVDHRGGVVVNTRQFFLVNRHDQHHRMLLRELGHQLDRGTIGDALGEVVPLGFLLGAEVGSIKKLLQANDLSPFARGLRNEVDMLIDHRLLDQGRR